VVRFVSQQGLQQFTEFLPYAHFGVLLYQALELSPSQGQGVTLWSFGRLMRRLLGLLLLILIQDSQNGTMAGAVIGSLTSHHNRWLRFLTSAAA